MLLLHTDRRNSSFPIHCTAKDLHNYRIVVCPGLAAGAEPLDIDSSSRIKTIKKLFYT